VKFCCCLRWLLGEWCPTKKIRFLTAVRPRFTQLGDLPLNESKVTHLPRAGGHNEPSRKMVHSSCVYLNARHWLTRCASSTARPAGPLPLDHAEERALLARRNLSSSTTGISRHEVNPLFIYSEPQGPPVLSKLLREVSQGLACRRLPSVHSLAHRQRLMACSPPFPISGNRVAESKSALIPYRRCSSPVKASAAAEPRVEWYRDGAEAMGVA
jgi:hypothetical protein